MVLEMLMILVVLVVLVELVEVMQICQIQRSWKIGLDPFQNEFFYFWSLHTSTKSFYQGSNS